MLLPNCHTNDGRLIIDIELIDHHIYGTVVCDGYQELCVWDDKGVFHHDNKHKLTIKDLYERE